MIHALPGVFQRRHLLYTASMSLPIVHHPNYNARFTHNRRFPVGKFQRLADILLEEGLPGAGGFHIPDPVEPHMVALAHDRTYVDQVLSGQLPDKIEREIGFAINDMLAIRARCASGGTLHAARLARQYGIACNTAGGGHHARWRHGAGYCVFNDVAIATRQLQSTAEIDRALVIDCDVHQGDGTADIFQSDPTVFTFSIHAQKNYPVRKVKSDLDIGLADGTGDTGYLSELKNHLPQIIQAHRPDIVFYNAGVDPHQDDRLGRLSLSDDGLTARDRFVIGTVREAGLPITCVVGGGYSDDIETLAQRHAGTYRVAAEFV